MRPPLLQPPVGEHSSNPVFAPKGVLKRPHPKPTTRNHTGCGHQAFRSRREAAPMPRAPRPCFEDGCPHVAVYRGRCREHAAEVERRQAQGPTKMDARRTRRRRAAVVAEWRRRHGDWCPGYQVPPHPATDLTAQHGDALVEGGAAGQVLTVLCRACNSRHAAVIMAPYRKNY